MLAGAYRSYRILQVCLSMLILGSVTLSGAQGDDWPAGYWSADQAQPILKKTLRVHLAPSLKGLSVAEQTAILHLLDAGEIMQRLYEHSRHPEALSSHVELVERYLSQVDPDRAGMLLELYRLSKGPIVTTLDNTREAFLPVGKEMPGKNVYPPGLQKQELETLLAQRPALRESLLGVRSVVRRGLPENVRHDLAVLEEHPALSVLHPGLRERLWALRNTPSPESLYALPYSVAYADEILQVYELLNEAALVMHPEDPAFARFLRNRARDLLSDDYEAGDASWVTGRFNSLNAQIGAYETYDDQLFGVKAFFGLSVLIRDHERSEQLSEAVAGLQAIEDSLPYVSSRKIRENIPVAVYNVVADFGQARGANSATILPNEAYLTEQYGRTILLRGNLLTHPQLFAMAKASFEAAVHQQHHADLQQDANLYRILWHEIGHYLGVNKTADGVDLDVALQDTADLFEEMKSDLVSLFAVRQLSKRGYYSAKQARAVYASGILRVLQKNRPRPDQPYQTMQLMQWNWLLEHGVLRFDAASRKLRIDYDHYHAAVEGLLAEVLSIQQAGNRERGEAFIEKYTNWETRLHGVVAANIKAREAYRYVLVTYAAQGDPEPSN
jgi:hypothetical protein